MLRCYAIHISLTLFTSISWYYFLWSTSIIINPSTFTNFLSVC